MAQSAGAVEYTKSPVESSIECLRYVTKQSDGEAPVMLALWVLHIPQISSITGASSSDCLLSYTGHLFGESYPSATMQSVYFIAPADWAL